MSERIMDMSDAINDAGGRRKEKECETVR